MTALLELRELGVAYGQTPVIHKIDLIVERGGITALLGANGAGKTTVLRAICNMKVRNSGAILFEDRRIETWQTEDIVRLGIAHVPDGRGTFVHLSVEENLVLGAYTRRDRTAVAQDFERIYSYFPRLKERAQQQAGTLSGGEQQMCAIGRALMAKPKLLMLDEPSLGLAPILVERIFDIVREINKTGTAILLVEQNALIALAVANRGYVLETGHVALHDTAEALRRNEQVRKAYLGES